MEELNGGILIRGVVFTVGLLGNIAVLVFLLYNFKKKRENRENFTLHLMLNLAVCDILCMLTLPVWIHGSMSGWTLDGLGLATCRFVCYVAYVCLSVSVMSVTLMSMQRYLVVLYRPQWDRLGRGGERLLLLSLWIVSFFSAIPSVSLFQISNSTKVCERSPMSYEQLAMVYLFETVFAFIVPFVILVAAYFSLHKKVYQKTHRVRRKMGKLVTAIVVTFFIFYCPYHIVNIMTIIATKSDNQSVPELPYREAREIVEGVGFLNSCVNPFLYAFSFQSLFTSTKKRGQETCTTNI